MISRRRRLRPGKMAGRTAPKLFRARAAQALGPREGGLASAQFRFDTPQRLDLSRSALSAQPKGSSTSLAAGSFIPINE